MRRLLCGGLLVLAACRSARTDVEDVLPPSEVLVGDAWVSAETTAPGELPGELPEALWWKRFEDPALDELVELVLAGNPDLQQAAATLREADARARSALGERRPALDASFQASRSVDDPIGSGRFYNTILRPQLEISWQADLFGRLRSTERARVAEALASESDHRALAHSLVAEAARQRVQVSLLARRVDLTQEVIASRLRTLEIVEARYARGVSAATAVDVHLARENSAAARAALPAFERERAQAFLALDELLGRKPGSGARIEQVAAPLPTVAPPPLGVPADLLDRRPDLEAARLRAEAGAAEVDVSLAALYPDLTLSASGGWLARDLDALVSPDTFVGSIAALLTAPLFSGGRLRADVEVARARLDARAAEYAATVLRALREVEDALVGERLLREELTERTRQRDEARRAEQLARERYSRGLENLLTVLDTERRRASAEDQVLLLEAAVWNARIDLHLALGGDWFPEETERSR